jgi:tRNA (mo5U34)-methyltransferase
MTVKNSDALEAVKNRIWFYEFALPDGTTTRSDIPADVLRIHTSRRDKLVRIIKELVPNAVNLTAVDFASHEGYYSIELARHFHHVRGIEIRPESVSAARLITKALGIHNVEYTEADLQYLSYSEDLRAEFVLVYGLLYHLENPIQILRLASRLSRRHILIETQVFPFDLSGKIEDGHYLWQRELRGVFGLAPDYSHGREGGSTDLALVPSLNALLFLLRTFGFADIRVIAPDQDDYEQFRRGSRVIVYGEKVASP